MAGDIVLLAKTKNKNKPGLGDILRAAATQVLPNANSAGKSRKQTNMLSTNEAFNQAEPYSVHVCILKQALSNRNTITYIDYINDY